MGTDTSTTPETDARAASVAVGVMCERASLFAQALADGIPTYKGHARAHVARVLGHAGAGFEDALCSLCSAKDEKTTREALRGLSRIGTARAAEGVAVVARNARDWMSTATVETMLRFPPEVGAHAIRDRAGGRPHGISGVLTSEFDRQRTRLVHVSRRTT